MAGNTLNRPLFKRGPQGDMRPAFKKGAYTGKWWQPGTWWPWAEKQMHLNWKERETLNKETGQFELGPTFSDKAIGKAKDITTGLAKQSMFYRGEVVNPNWSLPKVEKGKEPGLPGIKMEGDKYFVDGSPLASREGIAKLNPFNVNPMNWQWKKGAFEPVPYTKILPKSAVEMWGYGTAANLLFGDDKAEAMEEEDYKDKELTNIKNDLDAKESNVTERHANEAMRAELGDMGLPVTTYPTLTPHPEKDLLPGEQENVMIAGEEPYDPTKKLVESVGRENVDDKTLVDNVTDRHGNPSMMASAAEIQNQVENNFPKNAENEIIKEFNLDTDRIAQYKDELKKIMPPDDKLTSSLMLMQLGLGLMTGKTKRGGFGGFLEVAGKAGQEIIPLAMQVLQNKSQQERELAMSAFQMAREDDRWMREQQSKYGDKLWDIQKAMFLKDYDQDLKLSDPTKGQLSKVVQTVERKLPSGKITTQSFDWGQVYDKSPLGQAITYGRKWDMGNGTIIDFGNYDMQLLAPTASEAYIEKMNLGNRALMSPTAQDAMTQLASVFEANLPDIIKFQMKGIHTGDMPVGVAGGTMNWAKKLSENVKGFVNMVRDTTGMSGTNLPIVGFTAQAANDYAANLLASGDIISYASLGKEEKKNMKHNGYWVDEGGKFAGEKVIIDGVERETQKGDVYITDQYLTKVLEGKNPWNNEQLMIADQMAHIMGFLEARLKQPTGRLLADTIKSSIRDVSALGFNAGSSERVAQNLYLHTARLYNKYADTMAMANRVPMFEFQMLNDLGGYDTVSIMDYHNSYLKMMNEAGMAPAAAGINLAWTENIHEYFPNWNQTVGESSTQSSGANYKAFGSPEFTEIMKTLNNPKAQTFGGQTYTGQ